MHPMGYLHQMLLYIPKNKFPTTRAPVLMDHPTPSHPLETVKKETRENFWNISRWLYGWFLWINQPFRTCSSIQTISIMWQYSSRHLIGFLKLCYRNPKLSLKIGEMWHHSEIDMCQLVQVVDNWHAQTTRWCRNDMREKISEKPQIWRTKAHHQPEIDNFTWCNLWNRKWRNHSNNKVTYVTIKLDSSWEW